MSLKCNKVSKQVSTKQKPGVGLCALIGWGLVNLSIVGQADAALVDRGGGLIYDSTLDITWLADANYALTSGYDADGRMNWSDADTWAQQLSYGGYDDWRLPFNPNLDSTCDNSGSVGGVSTDFGFGCTGSEYGHLFYEDLGGQAMSSISNSTDPDLALFYNLLSSTDPLDEYWASEIDGLSYVAHHFHFGDGYQRYYDSTVEMYAMAVRDGDVSAVPVPAAVWLFGSGILGLLGVGYKRR